MRTHLRSFGSRRRFAFYAILASVALAAPQSLQPAIVELPFDPANFSNSLNINNPLFPLVAGKTFIYRGKGADGCEEIRTVVTRQAKVVAGVVARVIRDQAFEDPSCNGRLTLVEDTFDWFAQDDRGNVWYLGEDTKDCDGRGNCVPGAGSWQAGVSGARAGLIMLANPRLGDRYRQEFSAGNAEDEAEVVGVGLNVALSRPDALPPRVFRNCIRTRDFTRLEPGINEFKYYCANFGLIREDQRNIQIELVGIR